jgi:nickel-dependent lactate racemase
MMYFSRGSEGDTLLADDLRRGLWEALDKLGTRNRVMAVPPDHTRVHSQAGVLTRLAWEYYRDRLTDVMPAVGTHAPMAEQQLRTMFAGVPAELFRVHDWRNDVVTLGEVPAEFVRRVSERRLDVPWKAQVNRLLLEGGHDLILSIGQVVPHEVIGMANHNKNILVGTGGPDSINESHYLGAVHGMERIMGRVRTPVRDVLDYASDHFASQMPIVYVLTVVAHNADGHLVVRGLFIGDDTECFHRAAALSLAVNVVMLDDPIEKAVVYLAPSEFQSTWLGNKSIYRSRMAIADGGELVVLAPGVKEFGEDSQIDALIRTYGYVGTPEVLRLVDENEDLRNNLSAAAHLIHGSSEGRFSITYCPGHLTKGEVESVNFRYADLDRMSTRYSPERLSDGYNVMPDGERIYYISNPALGLWTDRRRFEQPQPGYGDKR